MNVTDASACIDDAIERHAPEFEDVDFLTILSRHFMIGVGQADDRGCFPSQYFLNDSCHWDRQQGSPRRAKGNSAYDRAYAPTARGNAVT
jgi:hypothetical protein